jgi:hypothetical protein
MHGQQKIKFGESTRVESQAAYRWFEGLSVTDAFWAKLLLKFYSSTNKQLINQSIKKLILGSPT